MADVIEGIAVSIGNASVGQKTASISVSMARDVLSLAKLTKFFVGARLDVTIHPAEDPDQDYIPGLEPEPVVAEVDSNSASVRVDTYGARLTFGKEVAPKLLGLAGCTATLKATRLGDVQKDDSHQLTLGGEQEEAA